MKHWNIRQRLLILALAPLFVTIVSMSIFYTTVRIKQFEQELDRKGSAITKQFAPACEYGVISGNTETLQQLANALLQEQDIAHVRIEDQDSNNLVELYSLVKTSGADYKRRTIEYSAPIKRSFVSIEDGPSLSASTTEPDIMLGKVTLGLLRDETINLQRRALLESIFITILALGITTIIALRMARRLSDPLRTISSAVTHIRNGNFSHRIATGSGGELGQLEEGINTLAAALHDAFKKDKDKNERLEAINRFLKDEVDARKQAQQEMLSAKDRAEAANQAKTEFLANMGHELRTPLNSVMGFTELLLLSDLDEEQRRFAELCMSSSQELLNQIRDILDFSKLEVGKLSIVSIAFNLRHAIQEAADIVGMPASRKKLELVIDYPPGQPEQVMGDPGRTRQILTNLLTNAINFTDHGVITIKVDTKAIDNNFVDINIQVSDTGSGIDDEKLELIFDRFTQADSSITRQQQGLGLGLAICKQLVTLMGGTIHAQSTHGKGSTFTLELKLPAASTSAERANPLFEGRNAIVVDDNTASARVIREMLEFYGLHVRHFHSGDELIKTVNDQEIAVDLVFIDTEMHDMNGAELATRLRELEQFGTTPFIALCTAENQRHQHHHLGMLYTAMLTKPVSHAELPHTIERVLTNNKPVAPPATPPKTKPAYSDKTHSVSNGNKLPGKSVLVIDDNAINRTLAVSALHKLGYPAEIAESGPEALHMLKQKPGAYPLILMDILMPQMDGYTTTREIRRLEQEHGLTQHTIIALTAKAQKRDREECLAAGMDDYMSKPLQLSTLKTVLAKWNRPQEQTGPSLSETGPS
ncbi:MAG: response regulator [Granulosicoccaceae bacterium]|jgi:two-component system sensor histidine kinase BarA